MTDLQAIVEEIHASLSPRRGEGKVADYSPQLAHVDPQKFGMAVVTVEGETHFIQDTKRILQILAERHGFPQLH